MDPREKMCIVLMWDSEAANHRQGQAHPYAALLFQLIVRVE